MSNSNGKARPTVKLVGEGGTPWAIMARVTNALRKAGYSEEKIEQYMKEAMSGNGYEHLLRVTSEWVEVEEEGQ